jgi:hypothetical protein
MSQAPPSPPCNKLPTSISAPQPPSTTALSPASTSTSSPTPPTNVRCCVFILSYSFFSLTLSLLFSASQHRELPTPPPLQLGEVTTAIKKKYHDSVFIFLGVSFASSSSSSASSSIVDRSATLVRRVRHLALCEGSTSPGFFRSPHKRAKV